MPKTVKRLLLFAAVFLLLLLFTIAFLTVPDQLREIPESHYFASVTENGLSPTGETSRPRENLDSFAEAFSTKPNWPEPDLSHLDTETQQAIEQCSGELLELSKQFMLVPTATRNVPLEDALKELDPLDKAFMEILKKHSKIQGQQRQIVNGLMAQNQEIRRQAAIGVYVEHGDWFSAGWHQSITLNTFAEKDSMWDLPDSDWDAATRYLRRAGVKGRWTLIGGSIQRRWYLLRKHSAEEGDGVAE